MKKVFALLAGFAFTGLVACGPSADEQKALEEKMKREADSVANALLQQAEPVAPAAGDSTAAPAAGDSAHAGHAH